MTLIDLGDIQLDCERGGSGPPLLMIMGMSGTQRHWSAGFMELLRADFQTITYDHRGVGASSRLQGGLSIAALAADAAALLDALGLQQAHVLGFSMGGMVAQELALAHPQRIATLTLAGTYCGGPGSALAPEQTTRILGEAMATRDREQAVLAAWRVNVSESFASNAAARARFMEIGMSGAVSFAVVVEQMKAIARHDTSARLGGIQAPTMILHGSQDMMLPVQNARLIAQLMPAARLEIIDGVGHLFFWEQPQRAAELVLGHAAVRT